MGIYRISVFILSLHLMRERDSTQENTDLWTGLLHRHMVHFHCDTNEQSKNLNFPTREKQIQAIHDLLSMGWTLTDRWSAGVTVVSLKWNYMYAEYAQMQKNGV